MIGIAALLNAQVAVTQLVGISSAWTRRRRDAARGGQGRAGARLRSGNTKRATHRRP